MDKVRTSTPLIEGKVKSNVKMGSDTTKAPPPPAPKKQLIMNTKEKTALQEFIDDLLSGKITEVLANKEKYLEKGKEQLNKAYIWGVLDGKERIRNKDYYKNTYENDTTTTP